MPVCLGDEDRLQGKQLRAVVIDANDNGAEAELKLHPRNLVRRLSHKHALAPRHQQPFVTPIQAAR